MRIPAPRRSSDIVASPRKRKRCSVIEKVRKLTSGHGTAALRKQHSSELKRLCKRERELVCEGAGIRQRCKITKEVGLMLKSHMKLTWAQKRKFKRVLKTLGVQSESEKAERDLQESIAGNHFTACQVNFEFKDDDDPKGINGIVVKPAPYVIVKDLCEIVKMFLDNYLECGKFKEYENIPNDEVWVKVGGDMGGGSFKLCFQIANLEKPNSPENTVVICLFNAPDSYTNLDIALRPIAAELLKLQNFVWKGRKVRVFGFGDYDFICKILGLSGAKGTYPCYMCFISKDEMQNCKQKRPESKQRTLVKIKKDHTKFEKDGGNLKRQSLFHNSIHSSIFNIPISHICIPYLHILLGIVKKHHDLLESACHTIDVEVAKEKAKVQATSQGDLYGTYIQSLVDKNDLEQRIKALHEEIEDLEETCSLATLTKEKSKITKLVKKKGVLEENLSRVCQSSNLNPGSGPVASGLEESLQKHNIKRQKYHGKSFVGNDCHKYLKKKVYKAVLNDIVSNTRQLTEAAGVISLAEDTKNTFFALFSLYSKVHKAVSHSDPIGLEELPAIQEKIDEYLTYFRATYPKCRIIPKQHLLEDHVVQWIERWGFGMGFHGEQGGESIHAQFNEVNANMRGIVDPVKKALSVMKKSKDIPSESIQQIHCQKSCLVLARVPAKFQIFDFYVFFLSIWK